MKHAATKATLTIGSLLLVALTACGTSSTAAAVTSTATASPKPSIYPGETASAIAALIPGCSEVKAGDVGNGGPSLASNASCVLGGRTLDVNSWVAGGTDEGISNLVVSNGSEIYYASGPSWTVNVRRDPQLEMQVTNDAAGLLKYAWEQHPTPTSDLPGEKLSSQTVVDALGGQVVHYTK